MIGNDWSTGTVGSLLTLEYGIGLPEGARSGERFPVYGSSGLVGRHDRCTVEGPGIIVGRKGSVGTVIWSREPFWPIDTTYYVKTKADVDLRWLFWALGSLRLDRLNASTGVPGLNRDDAYAVSMRIPPRLEQANIAEILDTADETIQQTDRLIVKLKMIKAGLLHDLLTRGLDENSQLRDPVAHPEQFKESELGRVPRSWQVRHLGDAATLQRGMDLPLSRRLGGAIPVYGSNGVDGWHNCTPLGGPGVITGRSGSIGFVHYSAGPYWPLNTTLYVKDFHGNRPRFVHLLLEHMHLESYAAATGVPSLNRNFVHPLWVAMPMPTEQDQIVATASIAEHGVRTEQLYSYKLGLLRKGLMHDLLTGRVRVSAEQGG